MTAQMVVNLVIDHLYFVLLILASLISINRPAARLLAILLTIQSVSDSIITWLLLEYGGQYRSMIWFPAFMATEFCLIWAILAKVRMLDCVIRADFVIALLGVLAILIQFFGFVCKVLIDYEAGWVIRFYAYGTQLIYWVQLCVIYLAVVVSKIFGVKKHGEAIEC